MIRKLNLLLVSVLLSAQTPTPEVSTHENQPTFTTRSNLVLVRVVVRDRKGLPNGTLQKEDFQIFDKGKTQFISKFSVEHSGGSRQGEAAALSALRSRSAGQTAPPILPDHYIAYVFDDLHLTFGDLSQTQAATERQLTEALGATGRAAIATTSGLTMLDFTDDVPKLRDTLLKLRSRLAAFSDCPNISYYMADMIWNKRDENAHQAAVQDTIACMHLDPETGPAVAGPLVQSAVMRMLSTGDRDTRISLQILHDVVRRISGMPGQRSVVLISPGFLALDQYSETVGLLDSAIRANVTIGSLDARGLYTLVPGGDASQSSGSLASLHLRTQYQQASAAAEGQVLGELAEGTGGTWIHNNNDLAGGLNESPRRPRFITCWDSRPRI